MSARKLDFQDEQPFGTAGGEVELISRPAGFSGAISLPLLPDLIQIYTVSLASGALTIRRGTDRGTIWLERGEMVHAVCGELVGEHAVYRLLGWRNGQFSYDAEARAPQRSITVSWQKVLMEGCRLFDEGGGDETADPSFATACLQLDQSLTGFRSAAIFDADGRVLAQRSRKPHDLAPAGPVLAEMLRSLSHDPSFVDCFCILGDQVHLIAPLPRGRGLQLLLDRDESHLAVTRRVVERVVAELL